MADIRCPKCGNKTTILTAKKDDYQYHVCINRPRCKGRVPVDEDQGDDWGDDWGKGSPATKPTHGSTRQRVASYPSERRAGTTIRAAKKDVRKGPAGVKSPERKGRGSFDKDLGYDWGEGSPTTKTTHGSTRQRVASHPSERGVEKTVRVAKKDVREGREGVKPPERKGRVSFDKDLGYDWGEERPATKTTHGSTRQRVASHPSERGVEKTVRAAKKDVRKGPAGVKSPEHKGAVIIDEVWGDDGVQEIPAPKPAPYLPQYTRALKREVVPEEKKSSGPPQQRVLKKGVAPEKEETPEPPQQIISKKEIASEEKKPSRSWCWRAPKEAPAPEGEKPSEPQQQKASKHASFLPLYKRMPKKYVASEKKEPLEPRPQITPKAEVTLEEKKPSRPWWWRAPKKEAAIEKKESSKPRQQRVSKPADVKPQLPKVTDIELLQPAAPETKCDEPQQQIAPKADTALEVKEPPKLRQRRVPQSYLAPEKKKRSMTVIVIAIVIAFLAIDGMIYAAFVLR